MKKLSLDLHYVKSIAIFLVALGSAGFYLFSNNNLGTLKTSFEDNIQKINQLNNDIKKNKKDLETFNSKIIEIDKFFVKDKKDFGLYKLMEHLDEEIKIYKYKYSTDQKQKALTNKYFYYNIKFVIKYESFKSMQKILDTIETKYHNSFVDAKFDKGKFVLTYRFYGKKGI